MILKLTSAQIAAVGAKDESEFSAKFDAFVANAKQMETVMANSPDPSDLEARIEALEKNPVALSEARVKELISSECAVPIKTFIGSTDGKALIFAEASRAVVETSAATGTTPAKDSPAPAGKADAAADLVKAGKFEEAYAASAELQAEFPDAKCYAAFAKAESQGRVNFAKSQSTKK